MTNKEKYPNAEVRILEDEYYVNLDGISYYLVDGKPNKDCTKGWFKTRKEAQAALDNFMNGPKPEITLSEIKSQLEEAKKLVGKTVRPINGGMDEGVVKNVSCHLDEVPEGKRSSSVVGFFNKNKYVIIVGYGYCNTPHTEVEEVKNVSVKAHDGQRYTAESNGDCWKFGRARIDKSLVKEAYNLFNKIYGGNRQVEKITIGKCNFDRETLKSLVELEN